MSTISVRNKLEILNGNVINVPGCEPVSSLTATGLLRNIDCNASIIPLGDALRVIPGSRIVRVFHPAGQNGTGWFFELPEGPPPHGNDCKCPRTLEDYYRILKDYARVRGDETESLSLDGDVCAGFNFSGCVREQDPLKRARDPDLRPNSNPLG